MEIAVGVFGFIVCLTSTVKSDDCDVIKISGTWDAAVSGQYLELSMECFYNYDSYRKESAGPFLYHTSGRWVVAGSNCDPNGTHNGYIRISNTVSDPEYINDVWEEKNGTIWTKNPGIKLICSGRHDDDDDFDDDDDVWMIVGITIAVIVAVIAIVLAVIYCPRKDKTVKPDQPMAGLAGPNQQLSAYYTGAGNNVAFMPAPVPGSMPATMPMGVPMAAPDNPWGAVQMPMAQVPLPSYNQAMSTEKTQLPDGVNMPQSGQMAYGIPGGGKTQ